MVKLLSASYLEKAGHCSKEALEAALFKQFTWNGILTDAKYFVKNCLLYVLPLGNSWVLQLLAAKLHFSFPNEALHFNKLLVNSGENYNKYVFVIENYFSK